MKWASAISTSPNLYKAIGQCVEAIDRQLVGAQVHLAQLFVSTGYRAAGLGQAGECALDSLQRGQHDTPTLIGAAVAAVFGAGRLVEGPPAVSLLAAHLPGIEVMPFQVSHPSLPPLRSSQWQALLEAERRHPGRGCGALLLSSPHFLEVEALLARLGAVLPSMPVVGGVGEPRAWADVSEHNYGALFFNDKVASQGAVGVLLRGPLQLQPQLQPGCRPVGRVQRVTGRMGNGLISELDGVPVHEAFPPLWAAIPERDRGRDVMLGLDASGSGTEFVARAMSVVAAGSGQPVVQVAAPVVPMGAAVQLLLRDPDQQREQQRLRLQALVESMPLPGSPGEQQSDSGSGGSSGGSGGSCQNGNGSSSIADGSSSIEASIAGGSAGGNAGGLGAVGGSESSNDNRFSATAQQSAEAAAAAAVMPPPVQGTRGEDAARGAECRGAGSSASASGSTSSRTSSAPGSNSRVSSVGGSSSRSGEGHVVGITDAGGTCPRAHNGSTSNVGSTPGSAPSSPQGFDPASMAVIVFSCVAVPYSEATLVEELLPQVAMAGAKLQGEFGTRLRPHDAAGAKLHSYASNIVLLRPWQEGVA